MGTSEPPAKRQKISKRESQNEEIIQAEHEIKNAVVKIGNELQKTIAVLLDIAQELKRRNQIDEQCRVAAPQQNRQQNYFNVPELHFNQEAKQSTSLSCAVV